MTLDEAAKHYRVYHRSQKVFKDIIAESAGDACSKAGWMIGDTWVRVLTPVVSDPTSESGHKGGGWANITPRELRTEKGDQK